MPEPSELPTWATTLSNRLKPIAGAIVTGFLAGERPPPRWVNWLLGMLCDWVIWHNELLTKITYKGMWTGQFTGTGNPSGLHMVTLTQDTVVGEASLQPELADFDGGAQADKLLLLKANSLYLLTFDVVVEHADPVAGNTSAILNVQSAISDSFASPIEEFRSMVLIPDGEVDARHQGSRVIITGPPKYVRFLLQNPSGNDYTVSSIASHVQATWLGRP
jgi:hypothetical protein